MAAGDMTRRGAFEIRPGNIAVVVFSRKPKAEKARELGLLRRLIRIGGKS